MLPSFPSPSLAGLHESRLADQERRFLRDFCGLMASAHYRLLGREEWAAAQAEEFLVGPASACFGAKDI